jgi:hypothetical protein
MLTLCLSKDPNDCLTLEVIHCEVEYYLIKFYCRERNEECDKKALEIINSKSFKVDYQCLDTKMCAMHDACQEGRFEVVAALIKKGAKLELKT